MENYSPGPGVLIPVYYLQFTIDNSVQSVMLLIGDDAVLSLSPSCDDAVIHCVLVVIMLFFHCVVCELWCTVPVFLIQSVGVSSLGR